MADTVSVIERIETSRQLHVTMTGVSDGTGELGATKVNISGRTMSPAQAGIEAIDLDTLVIEKVEWAIQGYTYLRFYWDTPEQNDIVVLTPGEGKLHFGDTGLVDPDRANATALSPGNIVLDTLGHSSGDSYVVNMWLRKKEA